MMNNITHEFTKNMENGTFYDEDGKQFEMPDMSKRIFYLDIYHYITLDGILNVNCENHPRQCDENGKITEIVKKNKINNFSKKHPDILKQFELEIQKFNALTDIMHQNPFNRRMTNFVDQQRRF